MELVTLDTLVMARRALRKAFTLHARVHQSPVGLRQHATNTTLGYAQKVVALYVVSVMPVEIGWHLLKAARMVSQSAAMNGTVYMTHSFFSVADACSQYPCDPNSLNCTLSGIVTSTSSGRICGSCRAGFVSINGICTSIGLADLAVENVGAGIVDPLLLRLSQLMEDGTINTQALQFTIRVLNRIAKVSGRNFFFVERTVALLLFLFSVCIFRSGWMSSSHRLYWTVFCWSLIS